MFERVVEDKGSDAEEEELEADVIWDGHHAKRGAQACAIRKGHRESLIADNKKQSTERKENTRAARKKPTHPE